VGAASIGATREEAQLVGDGPPKTKGVGGEFDGGNGGEGGASMWNTNRIYDDQEYEQRKAEDGGRMRMG
jgi:hypothetical protein